MASMEIPRPLRTAVPLPVRVALGAVAAVLLAYLFSALHADPSMRALPIVVFAAAAGAVGGALFSLAEPLRRRRARRAAKALSVLIFFLVIKVAFVAPRHGPL